MAHLSILGTGNMGQAIAAVAYTLKRAREREAIGFLQLTPAANEKVSWTGSFGVVA